MGKRLPFPLLLAYCLLWAAFIAAASLRLLPQEADTTFPEAGVYRTIRDAAAETSIYRVPQEPSRGIAVYGPLFYQGAGLVQRLCGEDWETGLRVLRGLVFLAFLGSVACVYRLGRRLGHDRETAGLAAALTASSSVHLCFSVSVRPDVPALLVSLGALLAACRFVEGERKRDLALWILLALLAPAVKQTSIAAGAAPLLFFLLQKRSRRAAALGLLAFLVLAAIAAAWARRQPWFGPLLFHSVLCSQATGFYAPGGIQIVKWGFAHPLFLVLPAWVGWASAVRRPGPATVRLLAFALSCSFLVAAITCWKFGSGRSYFLEFQAVASVFAAGALRRLAEHPAARARPRAALAALALVLLLHGAVQLREMRRLASTPGAAEMLRALLPEGRLEHALSESPWLGMRLEDRGVHCEVLCDSYMYQSIRHRGLFTPAHFLLRTWRVEYDLILLQRGGPLEGWLAPVLEERYLLVSERGLWQAYAPRPGGTSRPSCSPRP